MEVKNYYHKYDDWKTVSNWNKEYKTVIDESKIKQMWSNSFCQVESSYAAPDNVREMTYEEKTEYLAQQREKRHRQYEHNKQKKEEHERNHQVMVELRQEWNTPFQWLDLGRKVNNGAEGQYGRDLNYPNCSSPFGNDYLYFNIKDTTPFKDDEEKQHELKLLLKAIGRNDDE